MTQKELVEKWEHEFVGLAADMLTTEARGSALAILLKRIQNKVRIDLLQVWHDAQPARSAAPTANGVSVLKPGPLAAQKPTAQPTRKT